MEILDIVDNEDNVIGQASRQEVYSKLLFHRIVHVLIFNKENKLALQLRSNKVSFCPNHWSTTVGGHVQSGESYLQAAKREFQEELGIPSTNLQFLSKDNYFIQDKPKKFLVTFKTIFQGQLNKPTEEVTKVDFFSIPEIRSMINNGEKFHPELLFLLNKHFL